MYLCTYYKKGFYCEEVLNLIIKTDLSKYYKLKKSYEKGYIQDLSIKKI